MMVSICEEYRDGKLYTKGGYVEKTCCPKMEELLDDLIDIHDGGANIHYPHYDDMNDEEIYYCPFCGEKIEYKVTEVKRKKSVVVKHTIQQTEYVDE
jgi:hypothetical protein